MFKHYNECWELSRVFGLFLNKKCLPRRWRRDYSLRDPKTDLERIFQKKYAEEHFCKRKSPNQGTYIGTVIAQPPPRCAPLRQNQRASSERAIKQGVQGACPRPSFPHFSGEMGLPRRSRRPPPGRCAPRTASELPTQRVRTTGGLLRSPESPLCLPRSPSWHTGPNTRS